MMRPTSSGLAGDRSFWLRLAGTLIAIVLIAVLVREGGWDEIAAALRQISIGRIVAALALVLASRAFVSARWYILLRSGDVKISGSRAIALTFTGLFANNFLPTTIGGDVVQLAGAMQFGYDRAVCLASIAADRLMGMLGNLFTLPLGIIPLLHGMGTGAGQSVTLPALFSQAWRFVAKTFQALAGWLNHPMALAAALGCTWGHMLCTVLSMYVLIEGLGGHVGFWLLAGLWSLTYFVTLVPISINGYGVQELSLTYLLSSIGGLSAAVSLTVAVVIRALYIAASLLGAFYLPGILAAMNKAPDPATNPNTP